MQKTKLGNSQSYSTPFHHGICSFLGLIIVSIVFFFALEGISHAWSFTKTIEEFAVGGSGYDADFIGSGTTLSTHGVTNTVAHSGTKSFFVTVAPGVENIGIYVVNPQAPVLVGSELWWRVFVYFPAGFDFSNPNGSQWKFMRLTTQQANGTTAESYTSVLVTKPNNYECNTVAAGNPSASTWGYIYPEPGYWISQFSYPLSLSNACQNRNVAGGTAKFFSTGAWHSVELYQKQADTAVGAIRMWYDGILIYEQTNIQTASTGSMIKNSAAGQSSHLLGAWNGGASQTQTLYFDDMVMTNETPAQRDTFGNPMIGTIDNLSRDTVPPSVPSNLRVLP